VIAKKFILRSTADYKSQTMYIYCKIVCVSLNLSYNALNNIIKIMSSFLNFSRNFWGPDRGAFAESRRLGPGAGDPARYIRPTQHQRGMALFRADSDKHNAAVHMRDTRTQSLPRVD
jgi:hypothetical protein